MTMRQASGVLIYYVAGPVHPRHATLIRQELPGWIFRLVYEQALEWFRGEWQTDPSCEVVGLRDQQIPEAVWAGPVRAVIFSTVQPRRVPMRLLGSAFERAIPVIAIEEGHQLALTGGTINNYVLPVDHLFVASADERDGMIAAGVPAHRVEVTGWPFYQGSTGRVPEGRRQAKKVEFGLDPSRPVATLVLSALHEAGEGLPGRRHQLELAEQGLPTAYQLVVKPHPVEPLQQCRAFVAQHAPRARLIPNAAAMAEVLEATDLVLNRGTSQVCLEALLREIPVVILDTDFQTAFHDLAPEVVVRHPSELMQVVCSLGTSPALNRVYEAFLARLLASSPDDARRLTCQRIAEIAEGRRAEQDDRQGQWLALALYQAWRTDRETAMKLLESGRLPMSWRPVESLRRLLRCRATREDLRILHEAVGRGFLVQPLRGLWIAQLARSREPLTEADLSWMADFPPAVNVAWFTRDTQAWMDILLRSNRLATARQLGQRLHAAFTWLPELAAMADDIERYGGRTGRGLYVWRRLARHSRTSLGALRRRLTPPPRRPTVLALWSQP